MEFTSNTVTRGSLGGDICLITFISCLPNSTESTKVDFAPSSETTPKPVQNGRFIMKGIKWQHTI